MRQNSIKSVTVRGKEVELETFKDECSTYIYIPTIMERAGTLEFAIKHSPV
jgi:hypothetical protein